MKSLNRVFLIGHLVTDPQVRQTQTGKLVVNFPMATNERWQTSSGEKKEKVDFHRIIAWEKLGETCQKYLRKGSAIFIGGRIQNRSFNDQNGVKKFITEIIAEELNILTFKETTTSATAA